MWKQKSRLLRLDYFLILYYFDINTQQAKNYVRSTIKLFKTTLNTLFLHTTLQVLTKCPFFSLTHSFSTKYKVMKW